jgi:hypothetical protein
MPTLTRWYVRSALVCFVTALTLGVATALRGIADLPPAFGALGPVYTHLLMVGWVTQLIFGVAHWMFPRPGAARERSTERLGWVTYGLLNGGLLLRLVGEPLLAAAPSGAAGSVLALSALLQWLAGLGFVLSTWGRVKGR